MKYPHLAARVFNTPLLIHPQKLDAIIAGLGSRLLGTAAPVELQAAPDGVRLLPADMFSTRKGTRAEQRGYKIVDGVAVVSVGGALVHRSRMEADSSFLLGYNDIAADIEDAMANGDVHAVLQVWDSPGGEAQGAFEFADRMLALRGQKPMLAIADGMAASAAYLGASAADELVITSTGHAGSIGVVMRHVDFSQALATEGIRVSHIYAGAHKVDGNPYEPLPDAVRADFQAEIDGLYEMFIAAVATRRGMDPMAVRKTQAATYRGVSAIAAGLADRISTTDQLITELSAQRVRTYPSGTTARANANDEGASMSGTTPGGQTTATTAAAPAALTTADLDRARAEGHAAGVQAGTQAERERTAAILGFDRASTHMALAVQCVSTGLSAEQANAILGAAPANAVPNPAAAGSAFAAAMAATGNPSVTGIEAAAGPGTDEAALAAEVLKSFGLKA